MTEKEYTAAAASLHVLPRPTPWTAPFVGFPGAPPLLIGRERELAEVLALLRQPGARLLTITGPGGIGKTRLALAAAAEAVDAYGDGAVFVPLGAIRDPALVVPAIARAMEVRESPERPLLANLAAALRDRRLLLVLDNLEQVSEAAVELAALMHEAPRLTLLVTSRVPLRLANEQRYPTPPLGLPLPSQITLAEAIEADAVAFFIERAQQVRPDFRATDDTIAETVAICRRLDGIPLAIELAAAWSHMFSPGVLLERLERRLPLLTGGPADHPRRLQTMRDAIGWSYDLLATDAQRLFRRLAIFDGGFTLEAAGVVWEAPGHRGSESSWRDDGQEVVRLLAVLIDASLVQAASPDRAAPRFAMLETVREFAREQLVASGEEGDIARVHADFFMQMAENAEPHLLGPNEVLWQGALSTELGNLRLALDWALEHDPQVALRIAGVLWTYWIYQGITGEGYLWLEKALIAPDSAPNHRACALITASALAMLKSDIDRVIPLVAEATALAKELDDPILKARAWFMNGSLTLQLGKAVEAKTCFEQAVAGYANATASTDGAMGAWSRAAQGLSAAATGEIANAVSLYELAVADIKAVGSRFVTSLILNDMASVLVEMGDVSRARSILTEGMRVAISIEHEARPGEVWPIGQALHVLAAIDAVEGQMTEAALRIGAAEAVMQRLGLVLALPHQQRVERTVTRTAAALGAERYAALCDQGRADPVAVITAIVAPDAPDAQETMARLHPTLARLSAREHQVLRGIVQGWTDSEIAEALFISRKTASNHVASILRKLEVENRAAAVAKAMSDRLL